MRQLFAVVVPCVLALSPAWLDAQEIVQYSIDSGSQYTYKPSPFVGIPGGEPSDFQLDFGVSGLLTVQYGDPSGTASILSADITLSGNEAIQENPPDAVSEVTAARVADFLEARLFMFLQPPMAHHEYGADPGLLLKDFRPVADVRLTLTGGFDHTPADGTGRCSRVRLAFRSSSPIVVAVKSPRLKATATRFSRTRGRRWHAPLPVNRADRVGADTFIKYLCRPYRAYR